MKQNYAFRVAVLGLMTTATALAQKPAFEMADVHVSTTAHTFAQNFGGVLRAGKYVTGTRPCST